MASSGMTAYAKQQMLIISVGLQPFPSLYLALFTGTGDPSLSPVELTISNYVRKPVAFYSVSTTVLANSTDIVFPALGAGAFQGAQLIDAPAGTTVWSWIDQASSFTIPAATDLTFSAGTLTLTVS